MTTSALPPPAPSRYPQSGDSLSKGLKWSFVAHGFFFLFVIVKSLVFPSQTLPYIPSLRVDVIGLPDILKKDLAKVSKATEQAEPEPTVVKSTKAKDVTDPREMVLKPKQQSKSEARDKKLKSALARIKALAKINGDPEPKAALVIKGNAVSKGTSLSGDAKETSSSAYFDSVRDRLQENWALPVWIARQKLSAQVKIFIDSRGRLHNIVFMKSSGNPQFDDAVKKTITQSDPFPAPPNDMVSFVLVNGITFGFPL